MARKGIILAGGSGIRLYPMTQAVVKQLLPVYDKPMVFYPLSTLMLAGVREILIITTPRDLAAFENLLGDGARYGLTLRYAVQPHPGGLAEAFIIGRDFVGDDPVCLVLGDNLFYGHGLQDLLAQANAATHGAVVFSYRVNNPERYGVIGFDARGRPDRLEEKPQRFISNYAVTGLYFYDNAVLDIAAALTPSARGELEITDVNRVYLERGALQCIRMERGFAWLDAGTPESLLESAHFVQTIERRQGQRIACLEEIAARSGFIEPAQLLEIAKPIAKSDYGAYLTQVGMELLQEAAGQERR